MEIQKVLVLKQGGDHDIEAPPENDLEAHFREYSVLAKAYRMQGRTNEFFGNLAIFLLEFGCVHANVYNMPKKKACIIITEYSGGAIDWGIIIGEGVCVGLSAFQPGKWFWPALAHYLSVLYHSHSTTAPFQHLALPASSTQAKRQRALRLAQEEWQDETPVQTLTSPLPTADTKT